jgi:hypothetical protein
MIVEAPYTQQQWLDMAAAPRQRARDPHARLFNAALGLYREMRLQGRLGQLWAWLTGRSTALLDWSEVGPRGASGAYSGGVRPVELDRIVGSDSRCRDFDRGFHPLRDETRDRWIGIAILRLEGQDLAAVALAGARGAYFVFDGHHRISVARALGQTHIDADITEWETAPTPAARAGPSRLTYAEADP